MSLRPVEPQQQRFCLTYWSVVLFALWFLFHAARALLTGEPIIGRSPTPIPVILGMGAFILFWLTFWTIYQFMVRFFPTD